MSAYQEQLIVEHSELVVKIKNLEVYLKSKQSVSDDKIEFAYKMSQFEAMLMYEKALLNRLKLADIYYINGEHYERIGNLYNNKCEGCPVLNSNIPVPEANEDNCGSDYDVDKEKLSDNE